LWWEGNRQQGISPYSSLTAFDIPKTERKRFSEVKCFLKIVFDTLQRHYNIRKPELRLMTSEMRREQCLKAFSVIPRRKKKKKIRWSEWMLSTALKEVRLAKKEQKTQNQTFQT
jgi:hypothetical protein